MNNDRISDLSPLVGMPIHQLYFEKTDVNDITPLKGVPLRTLWCGGCKDLTDLHPLENCASLEELSFPNECRDIAFLERLPALRRISASSALKKDAFSQDTVPPASAFWKKSDEQMKGAAGD